MSRKVGRLHVITDTEVQSRFSHAELARMAASGGADAVQFRQKSGSTASMIKAAVEMRAECARMGVALIVNDRLDVAIAARADGVHLGRADFPVRLARGLLGPSRIIGATASTWEEAVECLLDGADYIGYGPVFATSSKADADPVRGVDALATMVRRIEAPVIAIGGIGPSNAREVLSTGAHGVAVISSVCAQPDPESSTRTLASLLRWGRYYV